MAVVREDVVRIGFDIEDSPLTDLIKMLDDVKKTLSGGIGDDAFDEMVKESKKANDSLDDLKDTVKGIKPDGINKTAKGLKETDDKAEDAHKELRKIDKLRFSNAISGAKSLASALGTVATKGALALTKATALAATAVGAGVKQSVGGYADYEQLVGGVETLFKDSAGTVQKYASEAWKTAGVSENAYMETVTSFSASLINSLGGNTGAAAELSNTAIKDMSDNANKMGTDMESLMGTYQSLARGNFGMLDNLKLGYGGTKEEMERLLKEANAINKKNGKNTKYTVDNFADIVEAIHVVQENMGITGTTAAEAEDTITGSANAMKASWSNMMTALVLGGDDFDRCLDNLVTSSKTFMKNLMPALVKSLGGMGDLIEEVAPILEAEFPALVEALLPPLIKAAASLVRGLITALPTIVSTLAKELPVILSEVWKAVEDVFGDRFPSVKKVGDFFGNIGEFCMDNQGTIKKLIPALAGLLVGLKMFKKFGGFGSLFSKSGGTSGGIFGGFTALAKLKPTSMLKGMLNLGIIIGGLVVLAAVLMWAAPYMADMADLKEIGEVLLVMLGVGLLGTAMSTLAGKVGAIPVATVTKGVANIGIAMLGIGALAALIMWVSPYMSELSDLKTTAKILIVMGLVGLVGSLLAGLAGIIGAIPISVVLTGLGNIALALGGFAAIVEAFGLLTLIPGFNEFLEKGGEVLVKMCSILGEMVGSVVGGFAEGVTNGLPGIGTNISTFATNISGALTTFNEVDSTGLSDFASAFGAFALVMAGDAILGWITGGTDYARIGTDLSIFGRKVSGFFTAVSGISAEAFTNATSLFDCLAGVKGLPTEGGIKSWFTGDIAYESIADGLGKLSSAAMVTALNTISGIGATAFTNLTAYLNALAEVKGLPAEGGIFQWFTGTIAYDKLASGLTTLTGASMVAAFTTLSTIPATAFTNLTGLFNALAGISSIPNEGGIFGWFTGDATSGLSAITTQLPGVATDIATFYTNLGGITDFSTISNLFAELGKIEVSSDATKGTGFLGLGDSKLATVGQNLADFATNAAPFFTAVNTLNYENFTSFFNSLSTIGELPTKLATVNTDTGTALGTLYMTFSDKLGQIVMLMNLTATAAYNSGVAITTGLINGINSLRPTLIATVTSMAIAVQDAFDVQLDINSPSRVMEKSGEFVGMGAINGVRNMIPDAKSAATAFARAATPFDSYTPEGSATTYNNSSSSEVMNVSPVFNLNISGSSDDRSLARKVKRYVSEAVSETLESLERKTYAVREA